MNEGPKQLHISTRNPSRTEPARILVMHLSRNGETLTQPENSLPAAVASLDLLIDLNSHLLLRSPTQVLILTR